MVVNSCRALPANGIGDEKCGSIGDAAVYMHAAVVFVLGQVDKLIHVRWLPAIGVIAVVWILQVAQRAGRKVGFFDDVLADQPVVVINHSAKNIGNRFVECARLKSIFEVGRVFDNAVCHFVGGNVQTARQRLKYVAAVAVGHVNAVPVGVGHRFAIFFRYVHDRDHIATDAVDAVSSVDGVEVVVDFSHVGVGRHGGWIVKLVATAGQG